MVFLPCFPPSLVVRDKGLDLRPVNMIITKESLLESQIYTCMLISYGWLTGGTMDSVFYLDFMWSNIPCLPAQAYSVMRGQESTCWLWREKES